MKKTGEAGALSLKDLANSVFLPSVYFTPSFSSTKLLPDREKDRGKDRGRERVRGGKH